MLGEIDRKTEVRRAVQPADEPIDDNPGEQLQVVDARQDLGIEEPRVVYRPDLGLSTVSSS